MNIETAKLCADLSNAVYNWNTWKFYLEDKYDQFLSHKIEIRNHEVGLLYRDKVLYVIVRGTESDSLEDVKTDLNFKQTKFPELGGGEVHQGFAKASKQIWDELKLILKDDFKYRSFDTVEKVVCTGHSLGGAVATLLSVYISYWREIPIELYTFGSPKALSNKAKDLYDLRHVNTENSHMIINHYRFVNNNDVVPKLPPSGVLWQWEHCGDLYYLNSKGKLIPPKKQGFWTKLWDELKGRLFSLGRFKLDGLVDHKMGNYVAILKKY